MKSLTLLLLFVICSFSSWSQDAILKRDGSKIDAKVVEITTTTIKYRNFDQPDGPIRNIAINDVQEIIYENGTWEKFEKKEITVTKEEEYEKPAIKKKDRIINSGLFIDGMIGMNSVTQFGFGNFYYDDFGNYVQGSGVEKDNYASLNIRLGSKWYFGTREKWRPGLQVTYFKLGLYLNPNANNPGRNSIALGNLGYTNAFKFKENIGMEANLNVGLCALNVLPPWSYLDPAFGINYGAAVKFRYKALAVGLDFSRLQTNFNNSRGTIMNVYSVTIGAKF